MTTKIRMSKTDELNRFDPTLMALTTTGGEQITLWEFKYSGTSSGSETEIDADDAEFDGTSTTTTLVVRSGNSGDDATGGHTQKVTLIGFDSNADPVTEEVSLNYNATGRLSIIETSNSWQRFVHAYGSEFGTSGQDAAADIEIQNSTQEAEVTIAVPKTKANIDNADSIHIFAADGDNTETEHYFWFDVDTAGADPTESGTAHEVAIDGDTSAADVASTLQGVIDGVTNLSASVSTDTVTVTCDNNGTTTDASQNGACCSSLSTNTQGVDITTYQTIAAGTTDSNGFNMYCPPGNYLSTKETELANITIANTGTTIVRIGYSGFEDSSNTDPDLDSSYVIGSQYNTLYLPHKTEIPRTGTTTATITIYESEMGTSGNEDFVFTVRFITWQ